MKVKPVQPAQMQAVLMIVPLRVGTGLAPGPPSHQASALSARLKPGRSHSFIFRPDGWKAKSQQNRNLKSKGTAHVKGQKKRPLHHPQPIQTREG